MNQTPRLKKKYREEVVPAIVTELGLKNVMEAPALKKIVVNMGLGAEVRENSKALDAALRDMAIIAGQQPVATKARKAISNFKIREGWKIGAMVTLRGDAMYNFFDRFVTMAAPRIRDFRGFSRKSFDGRGNYSLGIREQTIFPEINYDEIEGIRGMDICIVTSAKTDGQAMSLLEKLGFPFGDR